MDTGWFVIVFWERAATEESPNWRGLIWCRKLQSFGMTNSANCPGNVPTRNFPNRTTPRPPQGSGDEDDADDNGVFPGAPQLGKPSTTRTSTRPTTQDAHRTEVEFAGIDQRLSLLPVGVDVGEVAVSPDGKFLGFDGVAAGKPNIYIYPIDPLVTRPSARQLTDSGGDKSHLQFLPDDSGNMRLYYLEGRQIHWIWLRPEVRRRIWESASTSSTISIGKKCSLSTRRGDI